MDTWVGVVIAVAAVVLVALALMLRGNTGARRLDKKRAEAGAVSANA